MGRTHCRGRRSRPKGGPALEGRDGRERRTDLLRRRARGLLAAGLAILGLGTLAPAAGAVEEEAVTFPGGPLTVSIGPLGQCQSSYPAHGNNFYPGSGTLGDCGFFLAFPAANNTKALEGQTYGFNGAAFGGYGSQPGLDLYEEAGRSAVTGSGTAADPYTQTTKFSVNDVETKSRYALVTETTTYVNGEPQFVSTFTVKNEKGSGKIYFRAIYAGDLFVSGNDVGTGVFLAGPPRFIGGLNTGTGIIGGFQEASAPAPPWSAFQELPYPTVWQTIASTVNSAQAFTGTIEPNEVDNAAAVEWDQYYTEGLGAGAEQSFTVINRTQIPSNLQISPVSQTLTQGQTETLNVTALDITNQPYAGKAVRYTVSGANPKTGSVTLNGAGAAQISYVGNNAGLDTIQLFVDIAGNGIQTAGDPSATATVTFLPLPPKPTPNSSYKIQSIKVNSDGTITIVFVPVQAGTATLEVTVPTGTIARHDATAAKKKKCRKGQVRIKGKCRPKNTLTGRVTAKGLAGVPLKLTVKASRKIKAALRRGRTVSLTAKLSYKSALGGAPTVKVFHFKVKAKRKHHH